MKKLLLILLCLPMIGVGQQTYVPDDNFETYLENNGMGDGVANNNSVFTSAIDTVSNLNCSNQSISDLTGIEDFTALTHLYCMNNQLTSLPTSTLTDLIRLDCGDNQLTNLDVSSATTLTYLQCDVNQLTSLDVRNGNNQNFAYFIAINNPNLTCIDADNPSWSTTNWTYIDPWASFSNNCPSLCDSVIISFNQLDTATTPDLIYFDVEVFGSGPNVGYPGFVLLNSVGDTIGYENINTAGNVFTLMSNTIETRFLDVIQNFSLPFNGFIHLVDGWFSGNPNTECIYPFHICGTTSIEEHATNKELLKVTDLLGRETKGKTNQPLFYIYNDGTVEKRIAIE